MTISVILRLKALLIDYFCIVIYLIVLFMIMLIVYFLLFNGIPQLTSIQSQLISFFSTVFPITIYSIWKEAYGKQATLGKYKMGLHVNYLKKGSTLKYAAIRNLLKYLPWQLAHMAIIQGVYDGFDSIIIVILYVMSLGLPIIYVVMVLFRQDHRHLPDLLSQCEVVPVTD